MNRLKGTLYDGTSRLRRADGSTIAMYSMAGLAEYLVGAGHFDVFALAPGLPLQESSPSWLRHLHGLRCRAPWRPICAAA